MGREEYEDRYAAHLVTFGDLISDCQGVDPVNIDSTNIDASDRIIGNFLSRATIPHWSFDRLDISA